jgi:hypothetical protein
MDQPKHLLSVVTEPGGDVVYVHADLAGLQHLRKTVDRLIKKLEHGDCDHDHLHSPEWAGSELSTSMLPQEKETGCKPVHHVKLYAWSHEWKTKHGL